MVVEQRVGLRNMGARVTAGESQVKELKGEVEELQKELVNQRVELSITKTELQFYKNKVEELKRQHRIAGQSESQVEELKTENAGVFSAPVRGVHGLRFVHE
ncbi:uncharacterized protein ACWYII_027943 [Salvelinus alpinus]